MFKRILTYSILSLIALGGFFGNVDIDIQSINNISEITIQFTGNSTYAVEPDPYANETAKLARQGDPAKKDTTSSASVTMYNNLIGSINIVLAVLSAMISPIILFVGWLMSPDWTSGDLFGLRAPMYALWVTVSNIVYFIYAILLILIALGTMFGQDKFSYKVMLPKLALGILMVPFTWWFVQWTISISSVVTASIMTIPAETMASNDSVWFTTPSIPQVIIVNNIGTGAQTTKVNCKESGGAGCISPKEFLGKSGGMYGPLIVYGYSIFKFEEITELKTGLDIASAALQIVHTSIISTIMFAVFGLLTLALATMLLVRAMKLWMYAIFAPLFTFRFVAGSNLLGGDDDSFSIKEFIGLAFVPAIVGLTLSFGLIIINAVQGSGNSSPSTASSKTCDLTSNEGCTIINIMGSADNKITRKIELPGSPDAYTNTKFEFGSVQFYFFGKATNQTSTTTNASGAIDALGGMFGTLIVDVIALVFIWMAFMAAKNVSKAVKAVAQPFEDIGNKIGGLAKSLPKYAPILPQNMGGSISGMGKVADGLSRIPETRSTERFEKSDVGKWIKNQTNGASVAETQKLREAIISSPSNIKDAVRMSKEGFQNEGIKTILENEETLKKNISLGGYADSEKKKILELVEKAKKDGKLSPNDSIILQAIMSGAKSDIDVSKAEDIVKGFKAGTSTTGGASGATGIATKVNDSTINLNNITDKVIQINTTDGGKKVIFEAKDAEKIKGKNATMTEEGFRDSLMTSGTMTEEGIADLIDKMKTANKDFFKK